MRYPVEQYRASSQTYSVGRDGKRIEFIQIHYTSTMASAENNCIYFSGGNRGASAHFFIDGSGVIWQSVLEKDTAWAGGNLDINQRSVTIEVVSDGRDFSEAEIDELNDLVTYLMKKYNIPVSRVIRHYDVADYATIGRTVDPYKPCPAPYVNNIKWFNLRERITSDEVLPYSQIAEDGLIGYRSILGLQKIFDIYENGMFWGQPIGWKPYHLNIVDSAINYQSDPEMMAGSEVIMNMQRLCGYAQSGYLSKGFIEAWQGFVSNSLEQDGYFGEGTAKATQRWINYQLKKRNIKF